ncbi:MAG TPA: ABC transporter ATP-binding protein [Myxococcaceae bacterium]|nr:ABC transporter ATP-binding protein [Myxococcaceae bacterium]
MDAIELEGLCKRYGERRGIESVTLNVPEGSLFGFIGPNGAGKSTTIRTMLGLLRPTAGRARLMGRDVVELGPRSRLDVGYVAGETHFYPGMRVRDLLEYLGSYHPGDHRQRREELVDVLHIDTGANAMDLSLGNRKKVALVAAMQHRPRLLVLDEPTNGLDPLVQARLFELLQDEVRRGATVFFSSHVLSEVQRVCRTVAVLSEGRLVAVEDVARLRGRQVRRVKASFAHEALPQADRLAQLTGVEGWAREGDAASFLYGGAMPELLSALATAHPTDVLIEEPSLEEIFLRFYAAPSEGENHVVPA